MASVIYTMRAEYAWPKVTQEASQGGWGFLICLSQTQSRHELSRSCGALQTPLSLPSNRSATARTIWCAVSSSCGRSTLIDATEAAMQWPRPLQPFCTFRFLKFRLAFLPGSCLRAISRTRETFSMACQFLVPKRTFPGIKPALVPGQFCCPETRLCSCLAVRLKMRRSGDAPCGDWRTSYTFQNCVTHTTSELVGTTVIVLPQTAHKMVGRPAGSGEAS